MAVCNELSASQANLVPTTVLQYSVLSLLVLLAAKSLMLQCDELPNCRFIVIHTFQAVDQVTLHYRSSCTLAYYTTCVLHTCVLHNLRSKSYFALILTSPPAARPTLPTLRAPHIICLHRSPIVIILQSPCVIFDIILNPYNMPT